ncbi:hypothetical protein RBSWK_00029 [Rhodopirellula baltica SWK14]|uniref:Uncharacterized protein n=1 Tax=Rhodopirellula baltica SWK14 TaxID=993516 RepID=L7CQ88_RHOBT|nr:hypothetical protein RBSWK_00029 [Rhodopirellula baltica SWK14]
MGNGTGKSTSRIGGPRGSFKDPFGDGVKSDPTRAIEGCEKPSRQ